jgi:protein TIF31
MAEQALKELAPEDREQHEARIRELLLPDVAAARQEHESFLQQAVRMVRQSIVVSERVNGVDSHDAIQQYADLGLLEHGAGNVEVGLRLSKHAMDLWTATYGPRHPTLVTLLVRNLFFLPLRTNNDFMFRSMLRATSLR